MNTFDIYELQEFLLSRGVTDIDQIMTRINSIMEGIMISDKYDSIYYIQRMDDCYAVYPRGKVESRCNII